MSYRLTTREIHLTRGPVRLAAIFKIGRDMPVLITTDFAAASLLFQQLTRGK